MNETYGNGDMLFSQMMMTINIYDYTTGRLLTQMATDKPLVTNATLKMDVEYPLFNLKDGKFRVDWASEYNIDKDVQTVLVNYIPKTGTMNLKKDTVQGILDKLTNVMNDLYKVSDEESYKVLNSVYEKYTKLLQ